MGYILHHAIVVTSSDGAKITEARRIALSLGNHVSALVAGAINGYMSFLVAPDGSKEGWEESNSGDAARAAFIEWLNGQRFEDGSSSLKWAELVVGGDDGKAYITDHVGKLKKRPPT